MGVRGIAIATAGLALSLLQWPALAQEDALRLPPTSGWTVDFAEESCALRRSFGNDEHRVAVELLQLAPTLWLDVSVASTSLKRRIDEPRASFLPDAEINWNGSFRTLTTSDGGEGITLRTFLIEPSEITTEQDVEFIWLEPLRDAREKSVTGYWLVGAFEEDLVLLTGSIHEPMKVMRTCLEDLLTQWGLDAVAHRTLSRKVELANSEKFWSGFGRRGRDLMGRGTTRMLRARLMVDQSGAQTGCTVLMSTGDQDDHDKLCEVLGQEAEFRPALDDAAQPIDSYYLFDLTITRTIRTAIR